MKRTYLALILLLSFDALSAELWSVAQLQEAISKSDHKTVLLDVRTQSEYNDGHIQNAINIPHDQILKEPQLVSAYKHSQVVVFCSTGVRACPTWCSGSSTGVRVCPTWCSGSSTGVDGGQSVPQHMVFRE